ncbi:MAG: MbnP family protein [Flavobacteriales bacterium]|nr:hypothetical protein [Flavobacteriales bacterium]MCB9200844.1 hypothetical protein [Flavobacteriales bacterium]
MKALTKLTLFAAVALAFTACKKDEDPEPTPTTPVTYSLKLEFEFLAGMMPYDLNTLLADSSGTLMKFDKVRFFASNTELMDMMGNEMEHYHDVYMLVDADNSSNVFTLGNSFDGHVHMLKFNVGLDSAANHNTLLEMAPAPLNDGTMHWGWNPMAGYKFIVLEGRWDSDGNDLIDPTDDTFVYHVATDALLGEKMVMSHTDITADGNTTWAMHVDMAALAAAIDYSEHPDTHTNNDLPLAIRVRDALLASISIH